MCFSKLFRLEDIDQNSRNIVRGKINVIKYGRFLCFPICVQTHTPTHYLLARRKEKSDFVNSQKMYMQITSN